jgi:hypothetical protein
MKMSVHEVNSKDHPPGFMHIEVLVSFWDEENSPSYLTFFLKRKDDMTSAKIRTLAINKARQFLSKIDYLH